MNAKWLGDMLQGKKFSEALSLDTDKAYYFLQ